eukprot:11021622-Alexandrium_andersonii.AAC.1
MQQTKSEVWRRGANAHAELSKEAALWNWISPFVQRVPETFSSWTLGAPKPFSSHLRPSSGRLS